MAHVNYKEYWAIFAALAILTGIEVGIVYLPINWTLMVIGLFSLAAVKAGLVALFYMHLNHETKVLKLNVLIPMLIPPFYGLILISEAAWRMIRW